MQSTASFRGPAPIVLAAAHILVFLAGLIAAAALRHGAGFVNPFAPDEQVRIFFAQTPTAVRVSNLFLFGSGVPFGIFTVTIVCLLHFLGVRAAGASIALFGGLAASFSLFLSGITGWVLSVEGVTTSPEVVKAIYVVSFLCGGVFYAVGFGLLAAGVSVTCYFRRLLPNWLTAMGMILAITGELSWFSLIAYPANFFIPITRFLGFAWMIAIAVVLAKRSTLPRAAQAPDSPQI